MSDLVNPQWDDETDKAIWEVAGYTDWNGEYHNFEGVDLEDQGDWYANADIVTVEWIDAENGSTQYANLIGPWDDYDDLSDTIDTYFEEGTP